MSVRSLNSPTELNPDSLFNSKAGLQEIFSSIQGEGPYVGYRHLFVRFNACHLSCQYCDTPQKPAAESCQIETRGGSGEILSIPNPISIDTVEHWIRTLAAEIPHHALSLTGGEPLLYTGFLNHLFQRLDRLLPVYLETSGSQPEQLLKVMDWVDIIAMDIKLSSATGEPMPFTEHQAFYHLAQQKDHYVKLVFSNETTPEELLAVNDIVTDRNCTVILQPVTNQVTGEMMVSQNKPFELQNALLQYFPNVRVIAQTHKILSVL